MFLDGVNVAELGGGLAGSAACAVLGSLGASVTKTPGRPLSVEGLEPAVLDAAGGPISLLSLLLDEGKAHAPSSGQGSLADDLSEFQVVVCDRVQGTTGHVPHSVEDYLAFVEVRNPGVWVTISAHGLRGPNCQWTGTELTVAAAGGVLDAVTDPQTHQPIKFAGNQALITAGHVAALATCHGLDRVLNGRARVHVDVSAQEAVIGTGPVLRCAHVLLDCAGDVGARRYGAPAGLFPCRDGLVRISAMEDHQWQALVRALGDPEWARSFVTSASRIERADAIDAELSAVTAQMDKAECEQVLQRYGVPATAMYSPEELLRCPQFAARDCLGTADVGGRTVTKMDRPFQTTMGARCAATAEAGDPVGLSGLRVAEASHVLAVPLAGALLGAMGAAVTKLEDPERLDMYRRRGPYIGGTPGPNRSAYFAFMNHSKRSMVIDMEGDPDAVRAVLDASDVVIENFGPSRARRVGLDAAGVAASRPSMLSISSSGYGHVGPWSAYRAYAYNLQTACGLAYLTRTSSGEPAEIDVAWADLISGFFIATIVAAWAVGPRSTRGAAVDFSMAELIVGRFNEYLAAASAGIPGGGPEDGTNHQPPFVPNAAYPSREGRRLVAISVLSEEQWGSLKAVLGDPVELKGPHFASASSRRAHQAELDRALGALTARRDGAELAGELQAAGVSASPVMTPETLVTDAHLGQRQFFAEVAHLEWGPRRIIGVPWQIYGEGALPLTSAPDLGNAVLDR